MVDRGTDNTMGLAMNTNPKKLAFGPLIFRSDISIIRIQTAAWGCIGGGWFSLNIGSLQKSLDHFRLTGESGDYYLYLILEIILGITLIFTIFFFFAVQRVEIYDNGIIPGYRPLKMVLFNKRYFIPFNEIEKVGILSRIELENADHIWFLMKNGTVAEFEYAKTESEARSVLVPLLREKCPYAMTVPIYIVKRKIDFRSFYGLAPNGRLKYSKYVPRY